MENRFDVEISMCVVASDVLTTESLITSEFCLRLCNSPVCIK